MVTITKEDPWMDEWVNFSVPKELAKKEWGGVYRKTPCWVKLAHHTVRGNVNGGLRKPTIVPSKNV